MIESTTSRTSGTETTASAGTNSVSLTEPTDVRLGVAREDIASMTQVGDDLVIELLNGEVITIENFFAEGVVGAVESQIFLEGAVSPLGLTTSGLVGAGGGLLGGVGAAVLGAGALAAMAGGSGGSDALSPAEIALDLINSFDGTDATTAPSVADYIAAGVEGVTEDNLAALNDLVASSTDSDLSAEELAALVGDANTQVALDLINAYDGTDATTAPTADDYAAAGAEGVTEDNLAALNAAVAASDDEGLTADEVEALLADVELAAALEVLNDYSGVGSVEPASEDYAALGFEDLTPEQIAAVNALLPTTDDLTSIEEVQVLIDDVTLGALGEIVAAATDGDDATDAVVESFGEAGVTGVTDDNIDDINTYIAGLPEGAIDSAEELQAIVDQINAAADEAAAEALAEINAWDSTEDLAEVGELLEAVGIDSTIVTQDLLAAEGLEVAAGEAILAAVAAAEGDLTVEELQALVDETIAELLIDNMPMSTQENTATALEALGVTGVTENNQDEVQEAIAAAIEANPALADSPEELQAIVDTVVAGLADEAMDLINAYDGTDATTAPTIDDYIAAGVVVPEYLQGLSDEEDAAALEMLNEDIAEAGGDLTVEDVQDMMDALAVEVATNVVSGYDADSTAAEAPTLADYEAMGVTGVTADNLSQLNALVLEAAPDATNDVAEIEALIAGLAAAEEEAQALIEAFNDGGDTEPTTADFAAAGVEGVNEANIDDMNAIIEGLPEDTEMTPELLDAIVQMTEFTTLSQYDGNPDTVEVTVNPDGSIELAVDRDGDTVADDAATYAMNEDGTIAAEQVDADANGEVDGFDVYVYNDDGTLAYIDYSNDGVINTGRRVFEYNEDGTLSCETVYAYIDSELSAVVSENICYADYDAFGNPQEITRDESGDGNPNLITYVTYDQNGNPLEYQYDGRGPAQLGGDWDAYPFAPDGEIDGRQAMSYDTDGNQISIDTYRFYDDDGVRTEFLQLGVIQEFDDFGNMTYFQNTWYAAGGLTFDDPAIVANTAVDRIVQTYLTYSDKGEVLTDQRVAFRFEDGSYGTAAWDMQYYDTNRVISDLGEVSVEYTDYRSGGIDTSTDPHTILGRNPYGLSADGSFVETDIQGMPSIYMHSSLESGAYIDQVIADDVNGLAINHSAMRLFISNENAFDLVSTTEILSDLIADDDLMFFILGNEEAAADVTLDISGVGLTIDDGNTRVQNGRTVQGYKIADASDVVDGEDVIFIDTEFEFNYTEVVV